MSDIADCESVVESAEIRVDVRRQAGSWIVRIARTAEAVLEAEVEEPGSGPTEASCDVEDRLEGGTDIVLRSSRAASWRFAIYVPPIGPEVEFSESFGPEEGVRVRSLEQTWRLSSADPLLEVYSPSRLPTAQHIVGEHLFRSPVLLVESRTVSAILTVLPSSCTQSALRGFLGVQRDGEYRAALSVGVCSQRPDGHTYFVRTYDEVGIETSPVSHRYTISLLGEGGRGRGARRARQEVWQRWSSERRALPLPAPPDEIAMRTLEREIPRLWRERELNRRRVGAMSLGRSAKEDVWFSTWMNPLRSSSALFTFGGRLNRPDWIAKARSTRSLVLSAPNMNGLFPTVFVFPSGQWISSHHQGGGPGIYHLADMSWTMYLLLRWHSELEPDEETVERASRYATAIVDLIGPDGRLAPYVRGDGVAVSRVDRTWLAADLETRQGDPYLLEQCQVWGEARPTRNAEDGTSLLLFAELLHVLDDQSPLRTRILAAAEALADSVAGAVLDRSDWADFESLFSCSPNSFPYERDLTGQGLENTLPMHHTAAAFLRLWQATGRESDLLRANRTMDRLALYQQVWSPPWLSVRGFGGYGVMNTDAEWNDARQAQFAETHLAFAAVSGEQEHADRAHAAMIASFASLFAPWTVDRYGGWSREPEGAAAENHGHDGTDRLSGVSGFDWGAGSALATLAHFLRLGAYDA